MQLIHLCLFTCLSVFFYRLWQNNYVSLQNRECEIYQKIKTNVKNAIMKHVVSIKYHLNIRCSVDWSFIFNDFVLALFIWIHYQIIQKESLSSQFHMFIFFICSINNNHCKQTIYRGLHLRFRHFYFRPKLGYSLVSVRK